VVAIGAAVALLVIAATIWFAKSRGERKLRGGGAVATSNPSTRPSKQKIKVGVYLSQYCATGAEGTQWKYGHSCQMVAELREDPELEVIPLLERETEQEGEIPKLIHIYFLDHKPALITDPAVLKSLDVIVIPRINYVNDDVVEAIATAVKGGTGLMIRNTFGNGLPGYTTEVAELNGLTAAYFDYSPHPVQCEVIADHPILGTLKKGQTVSITANGAYGELLPGSTPLIRVKGADGMMMDAALGETPFYPLFLSQLGKGRIVQCVYPAWQGTPGDLQKATGGKFTVRAIKWAAQRAVD
jgi:hypothetical protein